MVATATMYVYTGTDAGTENSSTYLNLMSTDAQDTDDNDYQSARITIPSSGTTYSYERWFRVKFTDTFNLIENCEYWLSGGSASGTGWTINAGVSESGVTPVNTESSIATSSIPTTEGTALDIQNGTMDSSGVYTDYGVLQLEVTDSASPGDITTGTLTVQYDES